MPEDGRTGEPQHSDSAPDHGRWMHLYENHYLNLRRYFARHVRCPQDVEDLVQNVFIDLLGHYNHLLYPQAYVQIVARHQLFAYWRQKRRWSLIGKVLPRQNDDATTCDGYSDPESDPLAKLLSKETSGIVQSMIDGLTPALAEAIRLRFLHGLKPKEAAAHVGCSAEALKKRLRRARRSLAQLDPRSQKEAVRHDDPIAAHD
jgi:RNA polymerase sigma factor (sigma-70 family)